MELQSTGILAAHTVDELAVRRASAYLANNDLYDLLIGKINQYDLSTSLF